MDPPPPPPQPTTTSTPSPLPPPTSKLRLMCSYGGHIITRPHTKSLYYAGGDTRIITIPTAATTTLSSLSAHLSTCLHLSSPFNLKYQLPSHDLDSLISLSNDDDLLVMLDEHHRLSPTPSRIRLLIFSSNPNSEFSQFHELKHPKTETWFADVLRSAKIMQKGGGGVGFGLEGNSEVGSNNEVICGAESLVLETSSSFGSSSSSVSLSNLSVKGPQVEDFAGFGLVDHKVKFSASESLPTSENGVGVATAVSHPQTGTCQDTVAYFPAMENITSYAIESDRKFVDPPHGGVEMHKTVQVSGFPLSLQFDQPQVQFVQTAAPHYLPQTPSSIMPMSSYYVMSPSVPQQAYYQTNQPAPIYFVPVGHPYNLPMQSGLISSATVAPSHPQLHPNLPNPAQLAYKVTAASPVPEVPPQAYRTVPMANPRVSVPHNENHQQAGGLPQANKQAQSIDITSVETASYTNELDDDPLRIQIYKSQPPPPTLPAQYSTMTKGTTIKLSEALAQLHTDHTKQQLRTPQPQ